MCRWFVVVGLAAGLLSGCASTKFVGRPDLNFVPSGDVPAPSREDLVIPDRPSVIGPSDQINVDVFGVPEVSRTVTVDLAGQVSLPLAGTIKASGMTGPELAQLVTDRLRGIVRDPRVTVNVTVSANQVVVVDGAVTAPGVYPVTGRMSLSRAIARASGTTEFSKEDHVVVFRRANGLNYATLYDLRAIRQGMYADPEIFSNDVIVVGDSQARRIFKDVLAASSLITAPIIALVR